MYALIVTAKLNDIDPRAWLADVFARIDGHPQIANCQGRCQTATHPDLNQFRLGPD
jgi:hypothetical protein